MITLKCLSNAKMASQEEIFPSFINKIILMSLSSLSLIEMNEN